MHVLHFSQPETQVMDYQTQQFKILPLIATAYAMVAAGQQVMATYYTASEQVLQGKGEALAEVSLH